MRKSRSAELLPPNLEIERTLRQLRQENRRREEVQPLEMAKDNNQLPDAARALREFTVPIVLGFAIRRPTIQANNFELKPALIQMVQTSQFGGYPNESPDEHFVVFLQYCNIVKMNNVTDDIIRLQIFPFSLRDKA